jgi:hypothetical protein
VSRNKVNLMNKSELIQTVAAKVTEENDKGHAPHDPLGGHMRNKHGANIAAGSQMKVRIEVFDGDNLLYGAYPNGNVSVFMDTPTLEQVESALRGYLAYLISLISARSISSKATANGGS